MKKLERLLHGPCALALAALSLHGMAASETPATPRPQEATQRPLKIVAYVAGWSLPSVIPAEKLTHVNFAFARIDATGRIAFAQPQLVQALEYVLAARRQSPQLKVLVSVGGWQADGFSDAALTRDSRERFARSAVALLRRHDLDGIDLDWEYPGQDAGGIRYRTEDRRNFTLLLETMRQHLDAAGEADGRAGENRYLLTIASADREYFDHTEMDRLHVHLDWINVMTYDFFNSLTPTTGHHAGLYASHAAAPTDRNADASIRQHLAAGIAPAKLVMGVAFYGRGFTGAKPANRGLNQRYERYEADHTYAGLVQKLIGKRGFVRQWDDRAKAPFLWNSASRTFITYDDAQSIRIKAAYVREKGLGGMMFWELSQDRDGELLDAIAESLR